MFESPRGRIAACEHASHLEHPSRSGDDAHRGIGAATDQGFLHDQMGISTGCDLREVGHHEDLVALRHLMESFGHGPGGGSTDSGIDFVEDQGRRALGEHQT